MIDFAHRRLHHLRDLGHDRTVGNFADGLVDDPQRLAHLLHAHHVPVEGVAILANRNFEIEIGVSRVGLGLAEIPFHAAGAQHRSGYAQRDAFPGGNLAHILGALNPDAVGGEQFLVFVNLGSHEIEKLFYLALKAFVSFVGTPADAEGMSGQASATVLFKNLEDFFAVAEGVEERRDGADIESVGAEP